jgi:hypothetical protein
MSGRKGKGTPRTTAPKRFRDRNAGYIYEFSPEAQALERVKYIMKSLREGCVRGDWRLDEPDAARVVQYFRWVAEGQPEPENDPEWQFVIKWMIAHGQSFDWIMFGDPRCLIVSGARAADAIAAAELPFGVAA